MELTVDIQMIHQYLISPLLNEMNRINVDNIIHEKSNKY